MPRPLTARYPFGPVLHHFGRATHDVTGYNCSRFEQSATMTVLAEVLGMPVSSLQRWARDGIPEVSADRVACQLGTHPALLWPELWWENVEVDA